MSKHPSNMPQRPTTVLSLYSTVLDTEMKCVFCWLCVYTTTAAIVCVSPPAVKYNSQLFNA